MEHDEIKSHDPEVTRNLKQRTKESTIMEHDEMKTHDHIETIIANAAQPVEIVSDGRAPLLALYEGWSITDPERYNDSPRRIRGVVEFSNLKGFLAYVNDFKHDTQTVCFLSESEASVIFDYHEAPDKPAWKEHRALLGINRSAYWTIIDCSRVREMPQQKFVEFIDDISEIITEPKPNEILAVIKELRANISKKHATVVNDNGEFVSLEFRKEANVSAAGSIELPRRIKIVTSIFEDACDEEGREFAYEAELKIGYSIDEDSGRIRLSFRVVNSNKLLKKAFQDLEECIHRELNIPIYLGGR